VLLLMVTVDWLLSSWALWYDFFEITQWPKY